MKLRNPKGEQRKKPKWIVFCIGELANDQKMYIEKLNLAEHNIDVKFIDPIKVPDCGAGTELPKDIINALTGTSYLGYTVFCDYHDFCKDGGKSKRPGHFNEVIESIERHKGIPVFWSNLCFQVWTAKRVEHLKDWVITLKEEVKKAKQNNKCDKQIIDRLNLENGDPNKLYPADATQYSNGGLHIIKMHDLLSK